MTRTPGKWNVQDGRYVVSEDNVLIADCYADSPLDFALPDKPEYRANARITATAPTMLEVLENVAARWDKDDDRDAPELGAAIRNVIKKAKGQ